ncbi:MAG: peptidylprolyl isomerase [Oscillospiraceae bacterium]|nr:peptidylprolyl isomerase [Oscillospiraceae bacterium]
MGKASRVRNAKAAVAELKKEQLLKQEQEARRKKKVNIITAVVSVLLAIVFIGSILTINFIQNSGYLLRRQTALKSDNFSINAATFTYFFNYEYQNFINQNSNYLSYYGLDVETNLRDQETSDGTIWFDYFAKNTQNALTEILYLAEKATAEGMELGKEELAQIEEFEKNVEEGAKEQKLSVDEYIALIYGKGVNKNDVVSGLKLSMLATKFYSEKISSVEYSDDDINEYFNDHKNDFLYVDYKFYNFNSAITSEMSDAEKKAAKDQAKAYAERLMKATDEKTFDSILTEILKEQKKDDEAIKTAIESTYTAKSTYDSEFEVSKWAFDEGAKVGECKLYNKDNTYSVYMLFKGPYRDESESRSVRHILVSKEKFETDEKAKAKAEEILKEFEDSGKKLSKFEELVTKYTEDTGSASTGGLYENFKEGDMVEPFEKWSFDASRKEGDTGIVKTDYGYHIMYFVGKGDEAWKVSVDNAIKNEAYTALYEKIKKEFTVNFEADALELVNEVRIKMSDNTASAS